MWGFVKGDIMTYIEKEIAYELGFPASYPVNGVQEILPLQAMPQLFPKNQGMLPGQ